MEYTLENKYDLIRKYVPYGAEFYTKFYTKSANIIKEKRKNRNFLRFFWCSRRESNPQRPLRSCTYFANRVKYRPFFAN